MSKFLDYAGTKIEIRDPAAVSFDTKFHSDLYRLIFNKIDSNMYRPYVDVDLLHPPLIDVIGLADSEGIILRQKPSKKAVNPKRFLTQFYIRYFLETFPEMVGLVQNTVLLADNSISNAEVLLGEKCSASNFIQVKRVIDDINSRSWTREKDVNERQSGVSTLGTISETLLTSVFDSLVDEITFFKVNASNVQSYGDFVLMCLPNNLWISVKSNFARERLLVSGFGNDILGVGFFESYEEFTGQVRVRNFQRAGFLAIYCPDVAVTEEQFLLGTSTYQQIVDHHATAGTEMPKNINGKPLIRPLSSLHSDLSALLCEPDIKKRFTVGY